MEDVEDVYEYRSDSLWGLFVRPETDRYTRVDAERSVAEALSLPSDDHRTFDFVVVLHSKVIGDVSLSINRTRIAELGYSISRSHWGKGFASEATWAVVDWGFRELNLVKVFGVAHIDNIASHRVMEKLGMVREGVLRGQYRNLGEFHDCVYYGLLRNEWFGS